MQDASRVVVEGESGPPYSVKKEIERANAQMRHFRGVAGAVLGDAVVLLEEIWDACNDPRTWEEILEGVEEPVGALPTCGWPEFRKRLDLLRHYIDYSRRLCDGSF